MEKSKQVVYFWIKIDNFINKKTLIEFVINWNRTRELPDQYLSRLY